MTAGPLELPPPPEGSLPKNRKVTSACTACKIAKAKCSGQQPCTYCVRREYECVFSPENDQRRRIPLKRRLDDLEEAQDLFVRLLRTLRHRNPHVDGLLDYIRDKDPTFPEIKDFMDIHLPQRELEKTPELLHIYQEVKRPRGPTTKSSDRALDIARLCDIPPFTGPARPWTTVTDDDTFVSHLISLYFTWQHLFCNWIDRDLFLKDLNSGNVNATFCSPLLVNAILADACCHSDYPEACAVPGDITTKGIHFAAEAKRLLDAEEGEVTLATAQGIAILYTYQSVTGKDRLGWTYMIRACKAVSMLRSSSLNRGDAADDVMSRSLDHLQVGLFGTTSVTAIAFQKAPAWDLPRGLQLPVHQADDGEWFPYPRQVEPVPAAHRNCVLNQRARIGEISGDLCKGLFSHDNRIPRPEIEDVVTRCYARLLQWKDELPVCLHYTDHSVPQVLSLHLHYHCVVMSALAFLRTPMPDADQATLDSISSARQKCISSAQAVSDLVFIHGSQWGIDRMSVSDMQFISVAMFTLVDDLGNEKSHNAFLNLANALMSVSKRWVLTKGMFRMVQVTTMQANESLSPEVTQVFKRFERWLWRAEDWQSFSSAYPHFAVAIRQQDKDVPEEIDLDQLLKDWNELTISGEAASEESSESKGKSST
ncbi:hypothetical protein BO71DRAFT_334734 [Aspergillus ellipticus CBS 707.79]|uniref:Zn(2)-C6 fungal-type domain-containing protein n=1 Tax=Aspergillus ellipticus CBS 707.79 TaxID=1448320 RepID=A0A319D032_9EURO|nr:hypothetical protein BO71DRAFT_334734 [Aspergillus ellipticus CBS 707.79]